jgi:glycosyltransferase involved in cell wall biosynthesis
MPDIRVLQKECRSLAQGGYDVTLVARHPRDEVIDGVHIVAVSSTPKPPRLERLTKVVWKVYRTAAKQRAEIYHFHDPELLLAGLLLKLRGRKVIYDAHEAFTRKLRSKSWIPSRLRPLVAGFYGLLERQLCRTFDHVIAADVMTAQDLHASRVTVVANYPIIATKPRGGVRETPRDRFVLIYVGGLERDRGVGVMLDIAELLGDRVELRLLGRWFDPVHERRARGMANVTYLGFRPLDVVYEEMTNADLGLVLLQPVSAYLYAGENTNKIFEYMLCGLPVVASDFPAFQSFVTQVQCGICVDPTNAEKAAEEILRLLEKPDLREQMGRHGRSAVLAEYNWEAEKSKLLAVYEEVGGHPPAQPLAA